MAALTLEDHRIVTEAVAEAERHTAGEIVTVVADRSNAYADIALAWAAATAFTAQTLLVLFPLWLLRGYERLHGSWNAEWAPSDVFGVAAGVGIAVFFAMVLLQLHDGIRFALVPGFIKTRRSLDRAIDLFKVGAERRTNGRTGVLIYLSLREKRAQIVADDAITMKVAPEVWGVAMADMLEEIAKGHPGAGIAAGVRDVGAVLAQHFPRGSDDVNELPDRLIEL